MPGSADFFRFPGGAQDIICAQYPDWYASNWNGYAISLVVGDVEGNGFLDLVMGNNGKGIDLYLSYGGTLSATPVWSSGQKRVSYGLALGDLDPAVAGSRELNNPALAVYLNEGGSFSSVPSWSYWGFEIVRSVALGDIDNDGYLDLVYGNTRSTHHKVMLFLNSACVFGRSPDRVSAQTCSTHCVALGYRPPATEAKEPPPVE